MLVYMFEQFCVATTYMQQNKMACKIEELMRCV